MSTTIKIIDQWWFSGAAGTTGIVVTENEAKQRKIRIGVVSGDDEDRDAISVAVMGGEIMPGFLRQIADKAEVKP